MVMDPFSLTQSNPVTHQLSDPNQANPSKSKKIDPAYANATNITTKCI